MGWHWSWCAGGSRSHDLGVVLPLHPTAQAIETHARRTNCDLTGLLGFVERKLQARGKFVSIALAHAAVAGTGEARRWCEGPPRREIASVAPFGQAKPHLRWLWTLDWDVGWVGDLGGILGAFSTDGAASFDYLVAEKPHRAERSTWPYFALRNHLEDAEVWATLVVPQRMSIRMGEAFRYNWRYVWHYNRVTLALRWRYVGVTLALRATATVTRRVRRFVTFVTLVLRWRYVGVRAAHTLLTRARASRTHDPFDPVAAVRAVAASLEAGNHSFCEMRSPSLCARSSWCTQEGLRELKPALFGPFHWSNDVSPHELRALRRRWEAMGEQRPPGLLVHRVRAESRGVTSVTGRYVRYETSLQRRRGGRVRAESRGGAAAQPLGGLPVGGDNEGVRGGGEGGVGVRVGGGERGAARGEAQTWRPQTGTGRGEGTGKGRGKGKGKGTGKGWGKGRGKGKGSGKGKGRGRGKGRGKEGRGKEGRGKAEGRGNAKGRGKEKGKGASKTKDRGHGNGGQAQM